jgi:Ca2+-binding EF-hand superfamily protein
MTAEQREDFINSFHQFDKEKTGLMTFARVSKLTSGQGFPVTIGQIRNLARSAGVEKGFDTVNADQFADGIMGVLVRRPKMDLDHMIAVLEGLPSARGGVLSVATATRLLGACGEPLDKDEMETLADEGGLRADGDVPVRHLITKMMTSV